MNRNDEKKANRLIDENSPYLLQHAHNPVDWYPWGEEAFQKAKDEDKPVFLSIGYSTCHWCHVMEKESFEDQEVADLLNKDFVSIKVDREERPDLDQIYMTACQAMTGQGGWPLTVFLTAEKKPFFAATYLPKHSRQGINGLLDLLPKLVEIWGKERERIEQSAHEITESLKKHVERDLPGVEVTENQKLPSKNLLNKGYRQLAGSYDDVYGGFGRAPKFPAPHQLSYLIGYWKRTGSEQALGMAVNTLKAMHRGGIFDQLGYGIHRYSVDREWLLPHFEKMLYDQATTANAALDAYQASGDQEMADFAGKILHYVLTDLSSPEGGFYSAEDADSEGEEGTFYVWSPDEIIALLGSENGQLVVEYFGVTEKGNFEKGKSVLHRVHEDKAFADKKGISTADLEKIIEQSRLVLLQARTKRERPFRDDKIITAWNGMIIGALARGTAVLGDSRYAEAAARAADFIMEKMVSEENMLCRIYRLGEKTVPAFLEDYAFMAQGLVELYRTTFNSRRLEQAYLLTLTIDRLLNRGDGKLLFSASAENIAGLPVIAESYDGAMPSGLSVSIANYLKLGRLIRQDSLVEKGEALLRAQVDMLERYPNGHTALLAALNYALGPPEELVIAGEKGSEAVEQMAASVSKKFLPHLDLLFCPVGKSSNSDIIFEMCPFLKETKAAGKGTFAQYCRDMQCLKPVTTAEDLETLLLG